MNCLLLWKLIKCIFEKLLMMQNTILLLLKSLAQPTLNRGKLISSIHFYPIQQDNHDIRMAKSQRLNLLKMNFVITLDENKFTTNCYRISKFKLSNNIKIQRSNHQFHLSASYYTIIINNFRNINLRSITG